MARRSTRELDGQEIARMAAASAREDCPQCALHASEAEAWRKERHGLHRRVSELQAVVTVMRSEVRALAERIAVLADEDR